MLGYKHERSDFRENSIDIVGEMNFEFPV